MKVRYGSTDEADGRGRRAKTHIMEGTLIKSCQTASDEDFQLRPPAVISDAAFYPRAFALQ